MSNATITLIDGKRVVIRDVHSWDVREGALIIIGTRSTGSKEISVVPWSQISWVSIG